MTIMSGDDEMDEVQGERHNPTQLQPNKCKVEGRLVTQVCACMAAGLGMFVSGAVIGWPGAALPSLDHDPQMNMSTVQRAWVVGIVALCGVIGSFVTARVLDRVGRRKTLICVSPVMAVGWVIIALAPNLAVVLVGRAACGLVTPFLFSGACVYNSETPEPWLRGRLGSLSTLLLTIGILLSYVVGHLASWRNSCYILACPCLLTMLAVLLVPESPYFLMLKHRRNEAKAALLWLRGPKFNLETEMEAMEEKISEVGRKMDYRELLKPRTRKPFIIALFIHTLQQVSGGNILIMYTGTVFISAGVVNHGMATVYVGLVQLAGTMCSLLLMDHLGRRPMIITSTFIMGSVTVVLGGCYYVNDVLGLGWPSWIPLMTILVAQFGYCLGCRTVPWLVSSELFNTTIRTTANSICFSWNRILNFIVVQIYPFFVEATGSYTVFFVFGSLCLLCCIISILFLPETKGKSLEQIQDFFQDQQQADTKNKYNNNNKKEFEICIATRNHEKKSMLGDLMIENPEGETGNKEVKDDTHLACSEGQQIERAGVW
ncbi:hypothetical protein Pcinc_020801 [Petrolisthes cinctipes]|uniref:Major facilitator superfamily (MFS) profile domain-containing protein n=1 Tax=Petrolisthes cinctipes TaxID=88211 RepID=A0AAE1FLP7_PETCI|nr:hypothetical protein Pcinc_020801 [Petrolisthes cinctipes]